MAQKKLDWNSLSVAPTKDDYLAGLYRALQDADWQPMISDVIANRPRGSERALALMERHTADQQASGKPTPAWNLYVIRTERGEKPKPGDKIVVKTRRAHPVDENGKELDARQLRGLAVQGREHLLYDVTEIPVDERGCIKVGFRMACRLLVNSGVVGSVKISGQDVSVTTVQPLAGCREVTRGPVRFSDGHVGPAWRWLYCEVDDDTYSKLPVIVGSTPQQGAAGTDDRRGGRR